MHGSKCHAREETIGPKGGCRAREMRGKGTEKVMQIGPWSELLGYWVEFHAKGQTAVWVL